MAKEFSEQREGKNEVRPSSSYKLWKIKVLIFCIFVFGCTSALAIPSPSSNTLVAADTANTEEFTAAGTEPFWGINVSNKGIVYSEAGSAKLTFPYIAPMKAQGRSLDVLRVYRLRSKDNSILIIKKDTACSDGMSDNKYPYSATLILGDRVLEGCARKK